MPIPASSFEQSSAENHLCSDGDPHEATSVEPILADHGLLCAERGEGRRLPPPLDAPCPAATVPQLLTVPLSELPGGAHAAALT